MTAITEEHCSVHTKFQSIQLLFERALQQLPKMPMLWVAFLEFTMSSPIPRITKMRHIIAQSLNALPPTQHHHIWKLMKRWTKHSFVPSATVKTLWNVYLSFDTSVRERRNYFSLLVERGDMNELVGEWARFFYEAYCPRIGSLREENLTKEANATLILLQRTDMWETIQLAFQTKGWIYTGDHAQLETMVDYGATKVLDPNDFHLAYSVFLYGQGDFQQGRRRLRKLLIESPDPISFSHVFSVATEAEDELVEAFVQHPHILNWDATKVRSVMDRIFSEESHGDALFQLRRLAQEHDTLLNQAQLRNFPQSVPLWLKRVEIFLDRYMDRTATLEDLLSLWRQALTKCTQGMSVVDSTVGQLFHSFSHFLLDHNRVSEAIHVLDDAVWHTNFSSPVINADLLGLLVEVKLLSAPPSESRSRRISVGEEIIRRLSQNTSSTRQRREGLLTKSAGRSTLSSTSPLAWILALDLMWAYGTASQTEEVIRSFSESKAYTAESCAYVASQLYKRGQVHASFKQLEHGLLRFGDGNNPMAALFLLSQYISVLCFHYGDALPIDTFRDLLQRVIKEAQRTIEECPRYTVDVLMSCAAVEGVRGLYGNALRIQRSTVKMAVEHLQTKNDYFPLLSGIIEKTIEFAMTHKGIHEVRVLCNEFILLVENSPALIQRVSVHWAALEKRCGYVKNAHTVMYTYADTQNPDSAAGDVYWKLWEELGETEEDFEVQVRRLQQARVRHSKSKMANKPI